MADILQAARSYYGLADTESCTTQLFTNQAGQTCVAFEIALSNEDFAAIVQRMQNMQQPDTQPDTAIIEGPTVEAMRESYNALSKAEKGRYGSFAKYVAFGSDGIVDADPLGAEAFYRRYVELGGVLPDDPSPAMQAIMQRAIDQAEAVKKMDAIDARQVVHVDAPEEPEPVSMDAVWLHVSETSKQQRRLSADYDPRNNHWLIQWAMLTDEQKQKAKEAKP